MKGCGSGARDHAGAAGCLGIAWACAAQSHVGVAGGARREQGFGVGMLQLIADRVEPLGLG